MIIMGTPWWIEQTYSRLLSEKYGNKWKGLHVCKQKIKGQTDNVRGKAMDLSYNQHNTDINIKSRKLTKGNVSILNRTKQLYNEAFTRADSTPLMSQHVQACTI